MTRSAPETRLKALSDILTEVLEYFEDREDVTDVNEDGTPNHNQEAHLASLIRTALKG